MAIYGIGAYVDGHRDISQECINEGVAGVGWGDREAPEIHRFLRSLKVGDVVYIKAFVPRSPEVQVKAIGLVESDEVLSADQMNGLLQIGRRIRWVVTAPFAIPKPHERNNVRANTLYEEFHPTVQQEIMRRLLAGI